MDPDPGSALEKMDPDSGYFFEIYKTNSESKKILFFVFSIVKIWVCIDARSIGSSLNWFFGWSLGISVQEKRLFCKILIKYRDT